MIPVGLCFETLGVRYAEIRDCARLLDDLGFDSAWAWDHYISWNDPREPVLEGWTLLAGLAEATRRIRLGPLVANVINHHPARLAKQAATLQEIAGGRLEVGVGAGGYGGEQARFGVEQGTVAERRARLAEALQIVSALWTGEFTSFAGTYYQLRDAICAPAPVPRPPLIVGGRSAATAALAGRYADGLNLQWQHRERFPAIFAGLDAGLAQRGRDRAGFELSLHCGWSQLGSDPLALLAEWERLGFARVMLAIRAPFPLAGLERLAIRLGL